MEDIKTEETTEEIVETETEETSPETQESTEVETVATEETTEDSKDIDYKKDLKTLQDSKPGKTELEKAEFSLKKNADRVEELGGDPTSILPQTEEVKEDTDVETAVGIEFAKREAQALAKSPEEYDLIMYRVRNQGLTVEEAHLLANKGKILKQDSETKRADVPISQGGGAGQKTLTTEVPDMPQEQVDVLARRGVKLDPKTGTYKGKFTETYYDTEKGWTSRKLQK